MLFQGQDSEDYNVLPAVSGSNADGNVQVVICIKIDEFSITNHGVPLQKR